MVIFKCKMCGGTIEFNQGDTVGICDSCGTKQTLPRLDDDKKANLYDRANHFRRNNDYDKAMGIYEQILNEDNTDSEAYWSLVLCRYGIEYVEDPATHKRVPTVNRAQFTSIFDDDNYKQALHYADSSQRVIYEQEATLINEIQKGILAISQKEEPFDVFICYKETDNNGRRTQDSVLANDLYHQLTQEGFKVFFSRITLEDKLGTAYEPYIFAALNSAKVMVVIGTRPENFNAVWVKNEWSRFLALVKNDSSKVLIPAYRDMDPYDLPEEFSHLQAQDMSKLGFMQDLIRGIKKILNTGSGKEIVKETVVVNGNTGTDTEPLLKRAFMFLEDGNWSEADEYCEKVLDIEPENAKAYLGKLMAELEVNKREKLADLPESMEDKNNFIKAVRFGDDKLKAELDGYEEAIENNLKSVCISHLVYCLKKRLKAETECKENEDLADAIIQAFDNEKKAETLRNLKEKQQELNKLYEHFTEFEQELKETSERFSDYEREFELANKSYSILKNKCDEMQTQKNILEEELSMLKEERAELRVFAGKKKKELDAKIVEQKKSISEKDAMIEKIEVDMPDCKAELEKIREKKDFYKEALEGCKSKFRGCSSKEEVERSLNETSENIMKIESAMIGGMSVEEAKKQYKASKEIQKIVDERNLGVRFVIAERGESVLFGTYRQKRARLKERIEWILLEKQENKVFMVSKYALDYKKYDDAIREVAWEECTLRKWLNKDFLEDAFDEAEQKRIAETNLRNADNSKFGTSGGEDTLDKVFLLSVDEANAYFSSDDARKCKPTEYAESQVAAYVVNGCCWWWLRSPGYEPDRAVSVYDNGHIEMTGNLVYGDAWGDEVMEYTGNAVRPALWVNIE